MKSIGNINYKLHALPKVMVTAVAAGFGIVSAFLGFQEYREGHPGLNVAGEWRIENTIANTTYEPFRGMKLGYRFFFHQNGRDVSAVGEKISENGQSLPSSAHSRIEFTGTVDGSSVSGTFTENGARRVTSGTFTWKVASGNKNLDGEFTSTAANANGKSVGTRLAAP